MGANLDLASGYDGNKHIWGPPGTNGSALTEPRFETNWIRHRREVWANVPEDQRDAYMEAFLGGDELSVMWDDANVFAVDRWEQDGIRNHFTTFPHAHDGTCQRFAGWAGSRDLRQYHHRASAAG